MSEPTQPRAAAKAAPAASAEDLARDEAAMRSGQVVREVLARCATARAYGVAARREMDVIDVAFEEVREPARVRRLAGTRPMRALPRALPEV